MIRGMTGFGNADISRKKIKASVEVKSVNHRYFDITYYMPIGFGSLEGKVRQLVNKHVKRGRITVSVRIIEKPAQSVVLNKEVVGIYLSHMNTLTKVFKLKNDLRVADVLGLPGVFESREVLIGPGELWPDLEKGIKRALQGLVKMRRQEGRSLTEDISDKISCMLLQSKKIEKRLKLIWKEKRAELGDEEFRSFQKGSDINEEISRLEHYIGEVRRLIRGGGAVGKRMDFIAQEMQRETNTIGSKVQDKQVSDAVIALKSKVEKIREQAQNIE